MKAFRSVTIIALSLCAIAAYAASDSVTAGTEPDQSTAPGSEAVGSPPIGMSQSGMRSGKTRA
jgi:hypothetical protein